jgi:uncharacterized protein YndB with AHSA1/START domain
MSLSSASETPAVPAGDQARVGIRVDVSPALAFEVFTQDINLWWRRGKRFRNLTGDQGLICLEPGVGGRVFESIREGDTETVIVIGRILAWEPPQRLLLEWRNSNFGADEKTEVEVVFKAQGESTYVTVTHRGWSQIRPDHPARHGLDNAAFLRMMGMWWADQLRTLNLTAIDRK